MGDRKPGWQTTETVCPHVGLIGAVFGIWSRPIGAEWVCHCGKVFVVYMGAHDGKPRKMMRAK